VPTAFIPAQDTGYLLVNVQMPPAAALHRTDATMRELVRLANETTGVQATFAVAGFSFISGSASSNAGAMFIVLDPFGSRTGKPQLSAAALANQIRAKYAHVQDGQALVLPPPPVRGMGNSGGFIMQVQDRTGTATPQQLQQVTEQLIAASRSQAATVTGLFSTFRSDVPQLQLNIDRLKLKQQGLLAADVFQTLQVYLVLQRMVPSGPEKMAMRDPP
jgi:multidrug efflux pump